MPELIFSIPIIPGKTQAAREMFTAMEGRRSEADAASARHGAKKETWFIQSSPQGDFLLGYLESEDINKSFERWVADQDPFVVWLKAKYKEIVGTDFTEPEQPPPPAQVWRHGY